MDFIKTFREAVTEEESVPDSLTFKEALEKCSNDHRGFTDARSFTSDRVYRLLVSQLEAVHREDKACLKDVTALSTNVHALIVHMDNLTTFINYKCPEDMKCRGTGFIHKIKQIKDKFYVCAECKGKPEQDRKKSYASITMSTVNHVISKLAANTTDAEVILFYNDDDLSSKNVRKIDFFRVHDSTKDAEYDWCSAECVTHDVDLIDKLKAMLQEYERLQREVYTEYKNNRKKDFKLVAITGHPHGMPKQVSLGPWEEKRTLREVRDGQEWCRYSYQAPTCPGSSGSPVFILGRQQSGFGYWFGHPHSHSRKHSRLNLNFSSIGTDQEENR